MTQTSEWESLAHRGQTLEAIVAYRTAFGVGLREAKEFVERWVDINLPPPLDYRRAARVADRLASRLSDYAENSGPISYIISVLTDRPDRHSGHPSILAADVPTEVRRTVEVFVTLWDTPGRFWRDVAKDAARTGTPLVVVIELDVPTVHAITKSGGHHVLMPGATLDGGDVLPGFACRVSDLFA